MFGKAVVFPIQDSQLVLVLSTKHILKLKSSKSPVISLAIISDISVPGTSIPDMSLLSCHHFIPRCSNYSCQLPFIWKGRAYSQPEALPMLLTSSVI